MITQFKRIIFTIFLLAAVPFFASAQKSASATMKVQVTVVEGSGITQKGNSEVMLSGTTAQSGISELTTLVLNSSSAAGFVIDRPETLHLSDNQGRNLDVPVNYTDHMEGKDLVSSANTKMLEASEETRGAYKGSLTTSVAYL